MPVFVWQEEKKYLDSCRKVLLASNVADVTVAGSSSLQQQQTNDEHSYRHALSTYQSTAKTAFSMALPGLLSEMSDIEAKRVSGMTRSITRGLELLQVRRDVLSLG